MGHSISFTPADSIAIEILVHWLSFQSVLMILIFDHLLPLHFRNLELIGLLCLALKHQY